LISQSKLLTSFLHGKNALKADFERVAVPHLPSLYAAALYLTKEEHEAEDLVQETYFRAYRFFHKFEPGTNCRAWLLSIQRHLFVNRYRQRKTQPEFLDWEKIDHDYESFVLSQENTEQTNPEHMLSSHVMGKEIEEALKGLPEEFRTAIVLVDIDELTYEEAAEIMECPIGTVRSRLCRGRRILQLALRDYALERGFKQKIARAESS
jgi:RNA polymerase sigma-70 factor, ECF subfamily